MLTIRAYNRDSGVMVDPEKIEALTNWTNQEHEELRESFGLTGYYRRFIVGSGITARPLTDMLKKNVFSGMTP